VILLHGGMIGIADHATMKQDHSNRNPNTPKSHGHRLHC